ncbi:MAG: regulatory iron-sulfur-containing complex subunit RicT [Sphaerochaetaceae bacterium]
MKKERVVSNRVNEESQSKNQEQSPETGYIYLIKNPSSNELSVCASEEPLSRGAYVIAPSRYGLDYGMVVGSAMAMGQYEPGSMQCQGACLHGDSFALPTDDDLLAVGEPEHDLLQAEAKTTNVVPPKTAFQKEFIKNNDVPVKISGDIDWIDSVATTADHDRFLELSAMEEEALVICREKIEAHGLEMKLVAAHYLFGEPKIIFFFTAASRVDFRDLVKNLVSVFRIRIELRQIGVRDEARVLGGLAVCGRDFCCHAITDKLNPVSIKMAKEQNLSLNSTKISGPCGRLLCCLSYEYDFYYEEKRKLPQEGSRLKIDHDLMKVVDVNILSKKISLIGAEGRHLTIPFSAVYHNSEKSRWEVSREYLDELLSN